MKFSNKVIVSVIMPCYNSEKFIAEAIKSVLEQSYKLLELIVIDDCSIDNSLSIINSFMQTDSRITLIPLKKNIGPGLARNEGLKVAVGKYITFLDSDDLWVLNKLETQILIMEKLSLPVTHTDYGYINSKGKISSKIFETSNFEVGFRDLLKRTEISCLTIIYNKEIVGINLFPNLNRKQDYVVWLDILKKGYKSTPLHFVSGYYRQQSAKKTFKRLGYVFSHFKLLRSDYVGLNIVESLFFTILYFTNGVIRYLKFI